MDNRHTTTKMWKGLRLLWKMKIQSTVFFRKERPATFWPDPFLSLKRCGLKNQQTERRLERHRGSWMRGCTLKIFLSERDAGVRGLNRRIKSKALFGQASTKTVTGQVISKVISSYVARNFELSRDLSGAPNVNFRKISVRKTIWDLEFSEHLL